MCKHWGVESHDMSGLLGEITEILQCRYIQLLIYCNWVIHIEQQLFMDFNLEHVLVNDAGIQNEQLILTWLVPEQAHMLPVCSQLRHGTLLQTSAPEH